MTGFRTLAVGPLLFLSLFAALSCGNDHELQSVAIQPSAADAKDFANGQVAFSATGMFSGSSSPVPLTSKDVTWCYGGLANVASPTAGGCAGNVQHFATVDQNGVAECKAQFQGTVSILAGTPMISMNPDGGTPLKVFGAATLTCP